MDKTVYDLLVMYFNFFFVEPLKFMSTASTYELVIAILLLAWLFTIVAALIQPSILIRRPEGRTKKRVMAIMFTVLAAFFILSDLFDPKRTLADGAVFASIWLAIFGLVSLAFPWLFTAWMKKPSRVKAVPLYFLLSLAAWAVYAELKHAEPVDPRYALTAEAYEKVGPEGRLMHDIASSLKGYTDHNTNRVRGIRISRLPGDSLAVEVELNTDDYPDDGGKILIESDMLDAYRAAFSSGADVGSVSVSSYRPVRVRNDPPRYELYWTTVIDSEAASAIDWKNKYADNGYSGVELAKYTTYIREADEKRK